MIIITATKTKAKANKSSAVITNAAVYCRRQGYDHVQTNSQEQKQSRQHKNIQIYKYANIRRYIALIYKLKKQIRKHIGVAVIKGYEK